MLLAMYAKANVVLWRMRDEVTREDGAVATEYGLLVVLIAIVLAAAAAALGIAISTVMNTATGSLGGTVP